MGRKTFYMFSAITQAFAVGLMAYWIETKNFNGWCASFMVRLRVRAGGWWGRFWVVGLHHWSPSVHRRRLGQAGSATNDSIASFYACEG